MVIDVQEKLFPLVDHAEETLHGMLKILTGCRLVGLPVVVTEQYPKGLGPTLGSVLHQLPDSRATFEKTTFSALKNDAVLGHIKESFVQQWILVGIEAHVCVQQTAKALALLGKEVVVINDAISSRSIFDFSTAIAEMKEWARVTSSESALFELIGDASTPEFKACLELIKGEPKRCCSG